jgi:carbamoyl-phosphate synthase small subunit
LEVSLSRQKKRKAVLVLEDGSIFPGQGFGATGRTTGEVVFSTGMVGYTEALTDPSYCGQILTLTYPLVGNYGVPPRKKISSEVPTYFESDGIKVRGLIVHSLCETPSHWASSCTLHDWLLEENIPGIQGIDTRELTKKLREKGVMLGILDVCEENEEPDVDKLRKEATKIPDPNASDLVRLVSITKPMTYPNKETGRKAVVIDCGVKAGIVRSLLQRGFTVTRVPYDFSSGEIIADRPDVVIVSNGPGDPEVCVSTIESVRQLVDCGIPVMGICLGNQVLALSQGAKRYKLKYGHRSQNQPALDVETGRCYITTQNHGYAVDLESLEGTELEVSFLNANDKTVEGVKHPRRNCFGVQFHPEASPGPRDTEFLFDRFLALGR